MSRRQPRIGCLSTTHTLASNVSLREGILGLIHFGLNLLNKLCGLTAELFYPLLIKIPRMKNMYICDAFSGGIKLHLLMLYLCSP